MLGDVIRPGNQVAIKKDQPIRGAGCRPFVAAAAKLKGFMRMRQELHGKRSRPGKPAHDRRRLIPRAVIDHNHFHLARNGLAGQRHQAPAQMPRLLKSIDDNADFRPIHGESLSRR